MTDKYDKDNAAHNAIKFGIEEGNGLPPIVHTSVVDQAFKDAGFELIESYSMHESLHDPNQIPWYSPLTSNFTTFDGFVHTEAGHYVTHTFVTALERIGFAPKGSTKVHEMLLKTAKQLVLGGRLDIFTPDYFVLGRKPLTATD